MGMPQAPGGRAAWGRIRHLGGLRGAITHLGGLLGDKRAHKLLLVLVPGRLGAAAQRVRSYFIPILQAWKLQISNLPGLTA